MSNLKINVEVLPGVPIENAVKEAKELCKRMDVAVVCFKLNGVSMSISQTCVMRRACERFYDELSNGKSLKRVIE